MACVPAFTALVTIGRQTKVPLLIGWVDDVPFGSKAVVPTP